MLCFVTWNLYSSINKGPFFGKLHSYNQNPDFPAMGIIILAVGTHTNIVLYTYFIYLGLFIYVFIFTCFQTLHIFGVFLFILSYR